MTQRSGDLPFRSWAQACALSLVSVEVRRRLHSLRSIKAVIEDSLEVLHNVWVLILYIDLPKAIRQPINTTFSCSGLVEITDKLPSTSLLF